MPTSLVATALRAMGQCPTEMDIHETIIKVYFSSNVMIEVKDKSILPLVHGRLYDNLLYVFRWIRTKTARLISMNS